LPLRITAALGLLAIAVASGLTAYHHPLPWFHHTDFILPRAYLMGMWTSVVACIVFIGFYSWRTAEESRRMAKALAAAELVLAREQKLSALDGLAAAAAHGLGTPLATIAVVAKELLRDAKPDDRHYDDILLLRSQSDRCREILADLAGGGDENDFIVSRLTLGHLLEEVVSPHRLVAVPIEVRSGPAKDLPAGASAGLEPVTQRNPGVIYGLGNLVENAIDFAASKVEVDATWNKDEVKVVIQDDGAGFPASVLDVLGEPFVTTRPALAESEDGLEEDRIGMGLGFFIAKTLLERSGARLVLANRAPPETGAVVTIIWPRGRFEQVWQPLGHQDSRI
jgi:two-component system sensor histidine kinase RegB